MKHKALAMMMVVLGALVVTGCTHAAKDESSNESRGSETASIEAVDSAAADLRTTLNALEHEHVDLAVTTLAAAYDGDPQAPALKARLLANGKEISGAIGSVYGDEAGAKFNEIWNSHLVFFENYTVAAKAGDKAGMDKAVKNLNGYVDAIAVFLSGANENLPKDAVAELFTEHVTLLKGAVDAHAAGDFPKQVKQQQAAYMQVGTIADATASAIVKQKPESFSGSGSDAN